MIINSNQTIQNSVIPIKKQGNKHNIFFLHAVSGFGFEYISLTPYLEGYDLYVVNDPKANKREGKFSSIQEMAACYLSFIKKTQPDGPYILCGWSFGGLVAYEMASQLIQQYKETGIVVLIDTPCIHKYNLHENNDQVFIEYIEKKGIKPDSEKFANLLFEMRNNSNLAKNYIPTPKLGVPVFLLKATTSLTEVIFAFTQHAANGWDNNYLNEKQIFYIQGDHLSIFEKDNAKDCAEKIQCVISFALSPEYDSYLKLSYDFDPKKELMA